MNVKRTEQGWGGHFCGAFECLFRRNTLLEYNDTRVVVSTVGAWKTQDARGDWEFETMSGRYYETMVFHAKQVQEIYWDVDVTRQIHFDSPWTIDKIDNDTDMKANDMHEKVVDEFIWKLKTGVNL